MSRTIMNIAERIVRRIRYALLPEFAGEPTGYRSMEEVIEAVYRSQGERRQ